MEYINKEDRASYDKGIELAREFYSILESNENSNLDEFPQILDWINNNPHPIDLIEKLCNEKEIEREVKNYNTNATQQVRRFYETIEKQRAKKRALKIFASISGVAAIIIIALFISLKQDKYITIPETISFASAQKITEPTLILKTGEMVELDNNNYLQQIEDISVSVDPIQHNKLVVPPKCKFRLELEDGSIVVLNADSELSYPISFKGHTRELTLHRGEAYFEVKKDERPFQVIIDNAKINVYGTKFTASHNSYPKIEAVLFEGSIGVSFNNSNETVINPGELLTLNSLSGAKRIKQVDTKKLLTWVNGFVSCDEEPLKLLLEQVSRWYDITFLIDQKVDMNILVNAYFNIERPLKEILKSIEDIANIKFTKIEEKRYTVKL